MAVTSRVLFAAAYFLCANRVFPQSQPKVHLRIGLVTASINVNLPAAASIARGVRLGVAESNQTAALFGNDVQLFEVAGSGQAAVTAARSLLAARKVDVLIGTSAVDAEALSRLAEAEHVIFLNVASRAQSLRTACRRFTFNIQASDAMYANAARAQLQNAAQRPNATGATTLQSVDSVALWAPALERFGASQINERYRDKYREGMDGDAWAGWAAVKIAADAALRAQSSAPAKLLAYLESPSTEFDGHKGWPLTFRRADHQLRQPLYIVATSNNGGRRTETARDVPELRAARDDGARAGTTEPEDSQTRPSDRALDALLGAPPACHPAK